MFFQSPIEIIGVIPSLAFLCEPLTGSEKPQAKDDAQSLEIVNFTDIPSLKLAFDHKDIINASGIIKN